MELTSKNLVFFISSDQLLMKYSFTIQGTASDPYQVEFIIEEKLLKASCNCSAGKNGQICKHRIRIIQGSSEGVISRNLDDIQKVSDAYKGSAVMQLLKMQADIENELETKKIELKKIKEKLSEKIRKTA